MERIDNLGTELFLSGPAEFLAAKIVSEIKNVPQFVTVFGSSIDAYQRNDYSLRELPALRVYNTNYEKEFESWFIHGFITLDIIMPPNVRRDLLQTYQDTIAAALCQQFRIPEFFQTLNSVVPGLNELGKEFIADKTAGFQLTETTLCPTTQIRCNFRLDLRIWDEFLVSDDRTKSTPFERTLGALQLIATEIQGLNDDNSSLNISVFAEQNVT